ncbi:MAG: WD40 repeat domain-containing protein [Vulcanimicrobiota bacterium]
MMRNLLLLTCLLALAACSRPSSPVVETPRATPSAAPVKALPAFSGKLIREFEHDGFYDQYLAFSPDGRYLLSWLPEKVTVFEVASGKPTGKLPEGHFPLGFSTDGKTLTTGGDGVLESWKLPSLEPLGKTKTVKQTGADGFRLVEWKSGKKSLLAAGGRVMAWPSVAKDYPVSPYSVYYSSGSNLLAFSNGQAATVLDPAHEEQAWDTPALGRSVTSLAVSHDGKLLVSGSMDGYVSVVDIPSRQLLAADGVPGEIRCLTLASDNRTIAVGCGDGMSAVAILDAASLRPVGVVKPGLSNTWALAISPDGKTLATGSDDGKIRLWQLY